MAKAHKEQLRTLRERAFACASLCNGAVMVMDQKLGAKSKIVGSSRLGRTCDDLDMARRALDDIIKKLQSMIGEEYA